MIQSHAAIKFHTLNQQMVRSNYHFVGREINLSNFEDGGDGIQDIKSRNEKASKAPICVMNLSHAGPIAS